MWELTIINSKTVQDSHVNLLSSSEKNNGKNVQEQIEWETEITTPDTVE